MGHLNALLRKNWILWKRNCFCSSCEILLPLVVILALGGIRNVIHKTNLENKGFLTPAEQWSSSDPNVPVNLSPFFDENEINALLIANNLRSNTTISENLKELNTSARLSVLPKMKNCIDNYNQIEEAVWQNGNVALGPSLDNPIVQELKNIFEKYYHYDTFIFKSNEELDDYTEDESYGNPGVPRVCFAIIFNESVGPNEYHYHLRFNTSGLLEYEIPPTDLEAVDPVTYQDYEKANSYWSSGMLTVQTFIDNFILKLETSDNQASITPQFSYGNDPPIILVHQREGVDDEFASALQGQFGVYLILPLIIIYLRMTYAMIYEKEKKLREGMKMMGLNNTSFYLSWILQYLLIYTLTSIIATILLKFIVFTNTDGFILFLNYWLFCIVLIFQSMFIRYYVIIFSVFFTRALFGLIVAIVWYLLMYMVISLVGNGESIVPQPAYWGASISSHAAMSFSFDVMVLFEAQGRGVDMSNIGTTVENYAVNMALIMHLANIIFYLLLSIYLDLVFPNEWGKKLHPLFCLPYFNRSSRNAEKLRRLSSQVYQERFEEVDQALKDQNTRQEVLQISHLTKIYPSGKQAVSNVNLTMYTGQIYALLGHNGAGKTTTISMLTGLLDITQGSATAYGLDVETQIEEIRKFMGVCPQHDILFDNMTVKEHLEMFATFKGMKPDDIPTAVRRMIEDVDLLEKTDYLTKNLSGGQKRRLSVAIAFIGNSKLIYLDEPTSGMDTSARRYIWEMLKNYKEDRIIVLTTHFMDEADFLGDRIGIMGEGKLQCSGSSVFLKNKFGNGYNLTIVKESTLTDSEPIIELIMKVCQEAVLISKVSAEILMQLPLTAISKFPVLFEELDKNSKTLKVQSYGISITTLEEVFLKVAQIGAGHHQVNDYMEMEDKNNQVMKVDDFDIGSIRITNSVQLFFNHVTCLLIKRARYFKRDMMSLCCEILLPCLVVLLGLILMTIDWITEPKIIQLTPPSSCYTDFDVQYSWGGLNQPSIFKNIQMELFTDTKQIFGDASSSNLQQMDLNYFNTFDLRTNIGWYYLQNIQNNEYAYYFFSNTNFREGPLVLQNQMNQALLQHATNNPNLQIRVTNSPMRITYNEFNDAKVIAGFLAALVFSMGMAFIPASIISYIVKEREINIKHQQLVSGVSVKAYWFSNWLMDLGKHVIPAIVCCLLILAFNISALIKEENYGFSWIIFFLYGWAIIPFCYVFSFAFKQQGNAMLLSFFLHLLVGSIVSLVIYILRLINSTRDVSRILQWIFRVVPSFSFAYGILNACSKDTYMQNEGWSEMKSTYDIEVSGGDILMLAITGLAYVILIFNIEYFEDNGQLQKFGSSEESIPYIPKPADDDVVSEKEKCQTYQPHEKAILVKDLRKLFILGQGKHKVAVDQVSFAIDQGEVFGLLGVNGAGKTTTFKILSGELKPTSGEAFIAGKSVINELEAARVNIGYCPQFDALLDNLTVREHIELFSDVKGIPYHKKEDLVNKKLDEMDLKRFENIQAGQLSGGNKRKLSVAIAMIGNPPIVFLDEPSTGMDPEARRFMWNVISRIATQRKQSTIILTTHSMEEAEALSTRIAIQVSGNLRCLGSVQHIKSKFGKGYEIEIKLEKPSREEIAQIVEQMDVSSGTRLNHEKAFQLLNKLDQQHLEKEIHMRGSGSHIYNDLRKPAGLGVETLAEFIIVEGLGTQLYGFIEKSFGQFEIIEHFQTFYRFRLESQVTVSNLFSGFEKNKNNLRISQYSIKQASIEQIFNTFANQDHDGQQEEQQEQNRNQVAVVIQPETQKRQLLKSK